MSAEEDQLLSDYREAVRFYLWYSGSRFSYFGGKTSKELADRYRSLANTLLTEANKNKRAA